MPMKELSIALVADELTTACLSVQCKVLKVTPFNYKWVLSFQRPDILFVESAWSGHRGAWKFKIAAYPDRFRASNKKLRKVVAYARERGIPTVFWNKEDGVHFNRFIDSARLFEHIFTVDENCIVKYRAVVDANTTVNTLMFPVQTATHNFQGFNFKFHRANFVGSYSHRIHDRRREWQNLMFQACGEAGLGLTIFDRNSDRKSENYRYPGTMGLEICPAVPHEETAAIYNNYLVSLNVNTIEDSASMYSRRVVEVLACGGILITNPTPAIEKYFKEYCHYVHDHPQAVEMLRRFKSGPSKDDLERAEAGARYVLAEHTWAHRLKDILTVLGAGR